MKWQNGASRIVEALQEAGVSCVFGLPGTQTVELFEALRLAGLRTVVATNELSAAFMAGGWARVTGEPGVLITISGPGFTWALTGIAEAKLDSVPLLHIVGTPPVDSVKRSFRQQELPETEIAAPLVKTIIDCEKYSDPGRAVFDALWAAKSGEAGPVMLCVTSTTLSREVQKKDPAPTVDAPPPVNGHDLARICERVSRSRRPVVMVGQRTNRYAPVLRRLVETLNAPLVSTPSARGVLPENHPLLFGFDPFQADVAELNAFLKASDVILAVGCKLGHSETSGFSLELPADRLVHVYASAEVVEANYPASLSAVSDAGALFAKLFDTPLQRSQWTPDELGRWRARVRAKTVDRTEPSVGGTPGGNAESFFTALRRAVPEEAILVLDSGLHQILARRHYSVLAPHGLIMPNDLQSMGFAIPTAIGASLARPDRPVIALLGDGGFAMTGLELLSAAREGIPLIVIVFADGAFGQIRLQQLANYGVTHGVTLQNPDFQLLALSLGAHYEFIGDGDDLEAAVRASLKEGRVTVLEVKVRDALPIRRVAVNARARELARRTTGRRVFGFLRNALKRLK